MLFFVQSAPPTHDPVPQAVTETGQGITHALRVRRKSWPILSTVPLPVFAQANAPVTRAQVRVELVQLEKAGYHVGDGDQAAYPAPIQAG